MEAYKSGNYLESLKQFTIELEKHKNNSDKVNEIIMCYVNKIYFNEKINYTQEFVNWMKNEAASGNSFAQNNLGYMYQTGRGLPVDTNEALKLYTLSMNNGNCAAANNIGWMYHYGPTGAIDIDKATKFYELSTQKGHCFAHSNMADLLRTHGQYDKAFAHYKLSVAYPNRNGLEGLSFMYENGYGVEKDLRQALKYRKLRAEIDLGGLDDGDKSSGKKVVREFADFLKYHPGFLMEVCSKYLEHDELNDRIAKLQEKVDELQIEVDYRPGGVGYEKAKENAESSFSRAIMLAASSVSLE